MALLGEATRQIGNKNYKAIIFRKSYPELQELIDRSHQMYPALGGKWKASEHRWEFPSGATIRMAFMDSETDKYKYQGHEYQFIGFDEVTHFTESQYTYMIGMCRSSDPSIRCYIRLTSNPGGIGHTWVKQRFIDIGPPNKTYSVETRHPLTGEPLYLTRAFVPAKVYDNPSLLQADPMYVARLQAMSEKDVKALLEGDWNVFEGQVFGEWDASIHVADEPYLSDDWPRYRCMDWGYSRPFAIYWFAVDYDGKIIVYREFYGCKEGKANVGIEMDPIQVGKVMAEVEGEERKRGIDIFGVADPAMWSTQGGPSIMDQLLQGYTEAGGHAPGWIKAENNRLLGKQQIHGRLKHRKLIVSRRCFHLIRTLPALVYDPIRVEDVDTKGEDHAYDAVRYGCCLHMYTPEEPKKDDKAHMSPMERKTWERFEKDMARREHPADDVYGDDW